MTTPARRAKELGTTTQQAANAYGCTRNNLEHKFKVSPHQFDIICRGVAAAWVQKEAERLGCSETEIVRRLLDAAAKDSE